MSQIFGRCMFTTWVTRNVHYDTNRSNRYDVKRQRINKLSFTRTHMFVLNERERFCSKM